MREDLIITQARPTLITRDLSKNLSQMYKDMSGYSGSIYKEGYVCESSNKYSESIYKEDYVCERPL